jgi:branched-chain amino acid transport system ATP-binding protein
MLEVENLTVSYNGLQALGSVSLRIEQSEFISIIGPNGAGKTTLLKTISGTVTAQSGSVRWRGVDLLAVKASDRADLGIAHVPEGRMVFPSLSVIDNIEVASGNRNGRRSFKESLDLAWHLFPALLQKKNQMAGTLSGGQQQMLALARGLAAKPSLLMLDEPSMGLAPAVADSIFTAISKIRTEQEVAVLLVEQRIADAIELSDRAYVLTSGRISEADSGETMLSSDKVKRTYFGVQ